MHKQKKRPKATGYHVINIKPKKFAEKVAQALAKTGFSRKTLQTIRKDFDYSKDSVKVRKIFDEEKPKNIRESQSNSLFLWQKKKQVWRQYAAHPTFEIKFSKQARIADAETFVKALATFLKSKLPEKQKTEIVRKLARKYWGQSMTYDLFEKYYELKRTEKKDIWVRKKAAPATLPGAIINPEILVSHKIRKKDLKLVKEKK